MVESRIRLFVKSVKTVIRTVEVERFCMPRPRLPPTIKTEPRHEHILPDDERKAVEMVSRIARTYGLAVEVVDVTRENVLHRIVQKGRERIRIFPTLNASSGRRVEGGMIEQQVEGFLFDTSSCDKGKIISDSHASDRKSHTFLFAYSGYLSFES
jgi:hypothetical protein